MQILVLYKIISTNFWKETKIAMPKIPCQNTKLAVLLCGPSMMEQLKNPMFWSSPFGNNYKIHQDNLSAFGGLTLARPRESPVSPCICDIRHSTNLTHCKVTSSKLSWLVAHPSIFRQFMEGKFDAYVKALR